jgi:hypothetical protein
MNDLEDYLAARVEHTITRSRFETIDTSQRQIKEASMVLAKSVRCQKPMLIVCVREENPLFYSFYSSHCQHFIMALCESVDLEFSPASVHALCLNSRLSYLLGGMIQYLTNLCIGLLAHLWGLSPHPHYSEPLLNQSLSRSPADDSSLKAAIRVHGHGPH